MWIYIIEQANDSANETYKVGFYNPANVFFEESVHHEQYRAAARVNFLNGGDGHLSNAQSFYR